MLVTSMMVNRRRLTMDALTALLAISGLALVVIGGSPPSTPPRRDAGQVVGQGPPGPSVLSAGPVGSSAGPVGSSAGPVGSAATGTASAPATGLAPAPATGPAPLGASVPVRLDIPAIGVSTALMTLGLNADGTVAVPPLHRGAPAGWYRHLATPGEIGPAVILGHVDSARDGPAVFHRLRELRPGDTITVRRADGSTTVFTVGQVAGYPKSAFPAEAVYGPVGYPALRLITCGGTFDRIRRQYRDNVIAYATLTATVPG